MASITKKIKKGRYYYAVESKRIDARILLYDTTNFFTFLATTNHRSDLVRRGHSKQKRHDLRQVGLAFLSHVCTSEKARSSSRDWRDSQTKRVIHSINLN